MAWISSSLSVAGGGNTNPELLWTNPNPTSSFGAQTVSVNLTDYEAIMIKVLGVTGKDTYTYNYLRKGESGTWILSHYQGDVHYATIRQVTNINNSGITFSRGAYGWSDRYSDSSAVPQEIYGYRNAPF